MNKGKRVMWLVCSSYKYQFAVSCNKLKWTANVDFCVLLPNAVVKSLMCAVMVCEHNRTTESDNEFLVFRGRLCSVTSATFLCLPTFSRAILSDLGVCSFQFRCAFRSVIHCSRIKNKTVFLHLYIIREKRLFTSSFLPVRLSVRIYQSNFHWIDFRGI